MKRPKWQLVLIDKVAVTAFGRAKIVDAGGSGLTRHVVVEWRPGVRESFYLEELRKVE